MVSGAVHLFANKRNPDGSLPKSLIKKRLLICFVILFVGLLFQFPANNLYALPFLNNYLWNSLFKVNILQLFSYSFFVLLFFFMITKNSKQVAYISFIIGNLLIISSHFTLQVDWFKIIPLPFAHLLSLDKGSIFPIFPFMGYMLIGVYLGYLLERIDIKNRNKYTLIYFPLIGSVYIIASIIFNYFYHSGLSAVIGVTSLNMGVSLLRVGVSIFVISFGTLLSYPLKPFTEIISMFSKRALFIYVIHLLIIYGSPIFPGLYRFFYAVDSVTAFYCAGFVIFFSSLLVYIYEKTYKRQIASYFYKYFIVALIIYLLLI